jgi:hypothetical protein
MEGPRKMLGSCGNERKAINLETRSSEQLLQGIPDEVTLDHICTRLPWRTFHILSSVSHAWRQAIGTRQVHRARVHAHSTETLVVLNHNHDDDCDAISLYSLTDKKFYRLPPIPHVSCRIPYACQCVALDGKIYLLGGVIKGYKRSSKDVYVLDLAAGQRDWSQCASMLEPRSTFGCGAMDGKIYVFGGFCSENQPTRSSEVYDPEKDSWESVMSAPLLRYGHQVAIIGEELALYGGGYWEPLHEQVAFAKDADILEFYHPGKDEWRRVGSSRAFKGAFVAQGRFYGMNSVAVYVHNFETVSSVWAQLHSFSLDTLSDGISINQVAPVTVLAVGDQLVAIVTEWTLERRPDCTHVRTYGPMLVQASGFGCKHKLLEWERANSIFLSFQQLRPPFLVPIHL